MTTRRNRTEQSQSLEPEVMCLPNNKWGFLLSGVKHFQGKLLEVLEEHSGLNSGDTRWVSDRLIEANILIDLIEGPEFRCGYRNWYESVCEELELIAEKQSPKLL